MVGEGRGSNREWSEEKARRGKRGGEVRRGEARRGEASEEARGGSSGREDEMGQGGTISASVQWGRISVNVRTRVRGGREGRAERVEGSQGELHAWGQKEQRCLVSSLQNPTVYAPPQQPHGVP